ncbi:AAA family ATPase [Paenibacillus oenotherae]|uniref:Nuclease SbcCD subunit C n=1 Tax=Paenibacillus oenotherae TaxID=1435645 RepID=A0ABS7DB02_9BACL|nr:AAA family ATPase [Paenibacillus oenotherae]
MNLKKVKIKNFRGYGQNHRLDDNSYTFEDLDQGLVVLNGFNGFGKTSFYEAIEWCLTDKISRLHALKERGLYDANTLKRSSYLKFISPVDSAREREQRIAEVELEFDNGVRIRRTTSSNFLSVTDRDRYESSLHIHENGDWQSFVCKSEDRLLQAVPTWEMQLARLFLGSYDSGWKEQLFKAHFLSQEGMNDFLRSSNAGDRRSILIRLLNLIPLEQIFDKSKAIKDSTRLSNKINQLTVSIESADIKRRQIDDIFHARNWGTFEEYLSNIKSSYSSLIELIKQSAYSEELNLQDWELPETIILNNSSSVLQKLSLKKELVLAKQQRVNQEFIEVGKTRQVVERIIRLDKRISIHKRWEQLNLLANLNLSADLFRKKELEESVSAIETQRVLLQAKSNHLSEWSSVNSLIWRHTIDEQSVKISNDFWTIYSDLESDYKEFLATFSNELAGIDFDRALPSDITEIRRKYNEHIELRGSLQFQIQEKAGALSVLSGLNTEYSRILDEVKSYILGNQDSVDKCPVCLSKSFQEVIVSGIANADSPIPDQLIAIIGHTLSLGDQKLKEATDEVTRLQMEEATLSKMIREQIVIPAIDAMHGFLSSFRGLHQKVSAFIAERAEVVNQEQQAIQTQLKALTERLDKDKLQYEKLIGKDDFGSGNEKSQVLSVLEHVNKDILSWEEETIASRLFDFELTIEKVFEEMESLKAHIENIGSYQDQLIKLEQDSSAKLEEIQKIVPVLDLVESLLSYLPGEHEQKLIEDYVAVTGSMENNQELLRKLTKYKNDTNSINRIALDTLQRVITEQLENNKLVNWIYKLVYPHPHYKEIRMNGDRSGINVKDVTGDVILDHLFSSAQLNILALSIFLGLGLTQNFSSWDQLFLDDPIQSMDDIKILSFIDVLRAISDSNFRKRSLIISTHDDNFAKLLAIKYRNKSLTQYNFIGYGLQGPLIERV